VIFPFLPALFSCSVPDPDPLLRGSDPDPFIIKQKKLETFISTVL